MTPQPAIAATASRPTNPYLHRLPLVLLLVIAVWFAGSRLLDAPWQNGDEFEFIVRNIDVTGEGDTAPFVVRIGRLFTHAHEDLYQPVPMAFYAAIWALFGDSPWHFRAADLLLHALNAILVWWTLTALFRRYQSATDTPSLDAARNDSLEILTWGLAALWALHPTLINAYSGDLGTPHMLAGLFCLLSLQAYLKMDGGGILRQSTWAVLSLLLLALANAAKPTPGWILLLAALLLTRSASRRPVYFAHLALAAAISVIFAYVTIRAGQESKLLEEAGRGLFGDPVSRSLLAAWYYARNLVAPFWLSAWYLPDPDTGWTHPLVFVGGILILATVVWAVWALPRRQFAFVVIGVAWFWGLLGPVLGFVGAREAIAFDRYLYQPLIAVMLIAGGFVVWHSRNRPSPARGLLHWRVGMAAILIAAACVAWNRIPGSPDESPIARARSPIRKALRVVRMNPGDPRALEMLAAQYDFSRNHALHAIDAPPAPLPTGISPEEYQWTYFNEHFVEALRSASTTPNLERYFATSQDRAQFHRRMAKYFMTAGLPEETLRQAGESLKLEPKTYGTWLWLARALRSLGRIDEARAAYTNAEEIVPDDPTTRAVLYTESGILYLNYLDDPAQALLRLREALATGRAGSLTALNLARAEIRAGSGIEGANLVMQVLQAEPHNLEAALVLGEYHLRSHHWDEAKRLYALLLEQAPTSFETLLGMQELAAQTGDWQPALEAWENAARKVSDSRAYRAFLVWALACAKDTSALTRADEMLTADPGNPVAQMAKLLLLVRSEKFVEAIDLLKTRPRGEPIPGARIVERCRSTLHLLRERGELLSASAIVEAALWAETGSAERGRALLDEFSASNTDEALKSLAERVRAEFLTAAPR